MVKVTASQKDNRYSLTMTGHAGYNPGNDIVCASCSAVAYALIGWCKTFPETVRDVEDIHDVEGDVVVKCAGDERFEAAFMTAVIGLGQIAATYPENVQLKIE